MISFMSLLCKRQIHGIKNGDTLFLNLEKRSSKPWQIMLTKIIVDQESCVFSFSLDVLILFNKVNWTHLCVDRPIGRIGLVQKRWFPLKAAT